MTSGTTYEELDSLYNRKIYMYKKLKFDMIWTMKDGTEIMIKDMEDSHVKNTINMLKGKLQTDTRSAWIYIFEDVMIKRRFIKINKITNNINGK